MLQQTQVDRVAPFFAAFLKRFPTAEALAQAPLSAVLGAWQGLGYNRRAKLLRECARAIVERHGGRVPREEAALTALPGIGPYTAAAIRAFAFDEPSICIETNIRAALIHHFFPKAAEVKDAALLPILERLLASAPSPREWYSALMDYGAHIKKTNPNPSRRSAHHAAQSKFEGSLRQIRGALIRRLTEAPIAEKALLDVSAKDSYRIEQALKSLETDGLIVRSRGRWMLAS